MANRCLKLLTTAWALSLLSPPLTAENWPGWRGPRGDGGSAETGIPLKWSASPDGEENIAWKVKIPYEGHSSPVVWGDQIFLVGADLENERRMLLALDRRTGQTLWEQAVLSSPLEDKHARNSHASSTPVTDGKHVFVSFLDKDQMLIAAYDFQGQRLWSVHPGIFSSVHGYCSSPVLYQDKVIVNGDHDGDAYIVALDKATGETVWKTERENKKRSYCTPIIREVDGRMQLMLTGSGCVASYNPDNGERIWIFAGPTEQFVASPVYGHGLLYLTAGFPEKHVMAIDPRGSGDIGVSHIAWHHARKEAAYVPSPALAGDFLYVIADSGIGYCYNALDGALQWRRRIGRRCSASLVSAENRIYFLDDDGNTTVVANGPEFEILAENPLGENTYGSPAISQGQIFIRGAEHLFCIGK